MPTSPTGNRPLYHYPSRWGSRPRLQRVSRPAVCRGVTLMEMMVVLAIITLIVGISFPSTIAGLENIRLAAGARSVAALMNIPPQPPGGGRAAGGGRGGDSGGAP